MTHLLLQSCSGSKQEVEGTLPAFELYSGYFYKILDKSMRDAEIRTDLDIAILSAKHGVLDPYEEIEYYDRRMDSQRAEELNISILDDLTTRMKHTDYDRLVINAGREYQKAINGLSDRVGTPILKIPGSGIGEKGNALYKFIRGDDSVLSETDGI